MNKEQSAAYIFAQAIAALIELESMKALNTERDRKGYALAYGEAMIIDIQAKYNINHNDVMRVFQEATEV